MRKYSLTLFIIIALVVTTPLHAQTKGIFLIKNTQKEMRVTTYYGQVKFFWWWILGNTDFQKQRILQFSAGYKPDSVALRENVEKLRALLPPVYQNPVRISVGEWRENNPDEKAIWFTEVFAEKNKGAFTVYGAYKIVFEGDDARIDQQRSNARIKHISFIFDKTELEALGKQLAALKMSQDVHN
jgi:hypothetical protein